MPGKRGGGCRSRLRGRYLFPPPVCQNGVLPAIYLLLHPIEPWATDAIRIERPTTNSKLFVHTRWDAVLAGAENRWSYVFLSFSLDDVGVIRKDLRKRKNGDDFWGNVELAKFARI